MVDSRKPDVVVSRSEHQEGASKADELRRWVGEELSEGERSSCLSGVPACWNRTWHSQRNNKIKIK